MAIQVTREEAAMESARRELARMHVADYARYMLEQDIARVMQPFHEMVCAKLESVYRYISSQGEDGTGRLMIFMPPGYWKSLLVARLFPSWALGKYPDLNIITTSYSSKMAFKNSRNCRDFVSGPKFEAVFGEKSILNEPARLSQDTKAVEEWRLSAPHRGGSWAAGVNGSITGERAHLFLIDDPFKDRKEAENESARKDLWEWFIEVAMTRLEIGGAVVIIQQLWHPDGLAGRLLKEMSTNPLADRWDVLSLMALWEPDKKKPEEMAFEEYFESKLQDGVFINENDPLGRKPGEALWPMKHCAAELEAMRSVDPYGFESKYQQRPYLRSGDKFERTWFTIVDRPPKNDDVALRLRLWDKAGSKSGQGDYTTGALMSITKDEYVYVEHMVRQRGTPKQRNDKIEETARLDKQRNGPKVIFWHQQDPGTAGLESAQFTNRQLAKLGVEAHFEPVTGDKEVRAGPWSSALEGGQAFLVRGAWNRAYIDEHAAFPAGSFDDQVDVSSWGYNKLTELASVPRRESRIL